MAEMIDLADTSPPLFITLFCARAAFSLYSPVADDFLSDHGCTLSPSERLGAISVSRLSSFAARFRSPDFPVAVFLFWYVYALWSRRVFLLPADFSPWPVKDSVS